VEFTQGGRRGSEASYLTSRGREGEETGESRQILGVKKVSFAALSLDQDSEKTRFQGLRQSESLDAREIGRAGIKEQARGQFQGPRLRGNQPLGRKVSMRCLTLAPLGQRIAVSFGGESGS
jgi:hypothetical protein